MARRQPPPALSPAMIATLQARRHDIATYFHDTPIWIEDNPHLRAPQREAYLAFKHHAQWSVNLPKLCEMPTGAGKTGVIAAAPFGIAAGRVLIITPNVTIREEITAKLDAHTPGNAYDTLKILPPGIRWPQVVELTRSDTPNLDDCSRADIIVANIHQAILYKEVFPAGFFDLLIVDESHHIPAESWRTILTTFRTAKKLFLTATPFRADGQPLDGDPIYRYRLADAIANGYVKNLIRVDAIPSRLVFIMPDGRKDYTQDDVLRLKEQDWFSRGVALSDACNETIIDKAIDLLNQKRRHNGMPHQIIASACSRAHAHRLVTLCQQRGLRATCILSSMSTKEQDAIKLAIKDHQYDCVVHVGMLGEGYDHPPFSIAAIFRPYRSRAPYEQFIGRTLRRFPGGDAEDNIAHIVSHVGLNLDGLWTYFRDEVRDAMSYQSLAVTTALDPQRAVATDHDRETDDITGTIDTPVATREELSGYAVDAFVPLQGTTPPPLPSSAAPTHTTTLATIVPAMVPLSKQEASTAPRPTRQSNRPDRARNALKEQLTADCKRAAGRLLHALYLSPDENIIPILGKGTEKSNFEVMVRLVHRQLNVAMGKDGSRSERESWSQEEVTTARGLLDTVMPPLIAECQRKVDDARRAND